MSILYFICLRVVFMYIFGCCLFFYYFYFYSFFNFLPAFRLSSSTSSGPHYLTSTLLCLCVRTKNISFFLSFSVILRRKMYILTTSSSSLLVLNLNHHYSHHRYFATSPKKTIFISTPTLLLLNQPFTQPSQVFFIHSV